jgi:hypothetical protein
MFRDSRYPCDQRIAPQSNLSASISCLPNVPRAMQPMNDKAPVPSHLPAATNEGGSSARIRPATPWSNPALVRIVVGLAIMVLAWLVPAHVESVAPAVLHRAGVDSPTAAQLGRSLLDAGKPGPGALVLEEAQSLGDPGAPALALALAATNRDKAELATWGAWEAALVPMSGPAAALGHQPSSPVLTLLAAEPVRVALAGALAGSSSTNVPALLAVRSLDRTNLFVPVKRPGGQALDAVILLTALLDETGKFTIPLQHELRARVAKANRGDTGPLEDFFSDLLTLGLRLDWGQLGELMRITNQPGTVAGLARLANGAPGDLAQEATAAILVGSTDKVFDYLRRYGSEGRSDLAVALADGQGAVGLLLDQQVPINHEAAGPVPTVTAALALAHPHLALLVRYLGLFLGAFGLLTGLEGWLLTPGTTPRVPRLKSGLLATSVVALIFLGTEPVSLSAAPDQPPTYRFSLALVGAAAGPLSPTHPEPNHTMDLSTLLSIGLFASVQIAMYVACLMKISEIARQKASQLLKLRLLENEDNLFDGGLYLGIAGTAAALVLQVLHLIQPNLLAAYSSNLFGILCVALVKIRHVRPYKRQLIQESQPGTTAP